MSVFLNKKSYIYIYIYYFVLYYLIYWYDICSYFLLSSLVYDKIKNINLTRWKMSKFSNSFPTVINIFFQELTN